jgi:arginine-tRNA-protein transferase
LTEQLGTRFPQFYRTSPAPCPYLPGRFEQKVFTRLSGPNARVIHEKLAQAGFRRSQNIAYKPSCEGCNACLSVRIRVAEFSMSRSMQRVMAANADVAGEVVDPWANEEQFRLLRRYLDARHQGGGMSEMTMFDYVAMVEDTAVETHLVEYRTTRPDGRPGPLIAVCLADVLSDGLSMVYSFYDVGQPARSLGSMMVLDHIAQAKARGLPYVYLGYFIEGCRKMAYKSRFGPLEARGEDGWERFRAKLDGNSGA